MPLPTDSKTPWPPKSWAPLQRDAEEAAVWYGGDLDALASFYTNRKDLRSSERRLLHARRQVDLTRPKPKRIHVPLAGDVAATSADLLFGEEPQLKIAEAHEASAPSGAKEAEDRLQEIADLNGFASTLLEAADVCAGLGGVYLRPAWDAEVASHPLLDVVHADRAVPEFRWGVLTAVTFWRVVHEQDETRIRHLERHENGVILHGLYVGDADHLGRKVDLGAHPVTRGLNDAEPLPGDLKGLIARYVPNQLPNRKRRNVGPIGRADTAGAESLMDALDETFSSWMRDIRLGAARLIVPREFLDKAGRGMGATFDGDREVFTPLDIDPGHADKAGITPVEFTIRTKEHADTALALIDRVVTGAGYSPQTFGLQISGEAESGTALRVREGKTLRTRGRKARYFTDAVGDVGEAMLVIDKALFGGRHEVFRPRLELSDGIVDDPGETAKTIDLLARAQAISIETRVRMARPDLDEAEVTAEVERIKADEGMALPDPTGGMFP